MRREGLSVSVYKKQYRRFSNSSRSLSRKLGVQAQRARFNNALSRSLDVLVSLLEELAASLAENGEADEASTGSKALRNKALHQRRTSTLLTPQLDGRDIGRPAGRPSIDGLGS